MQVMDGKIILFGGIIEVTKESNDSYSFDVQTEIWSIVDVSENNLSTRPSLLIAID
jgi:hypothetical protein